MSPLRKIEEEKCEECNHFEVCCLRDNLFTLRQTAYDLGKLAENQRFNITVKCNYYDKNDARIPHITSYPNIKKSSNPNYIPPASAK